MPYCPDCLTEYVEGVRTCEDCGTALLPGSPPPAEHAENSGTGSVEAIGGWFRSLVGAGPERDDTDAKMVRVRVFSGPTAMLDADLARNVLQASRIPCILPGETSAEMLPFLEIPLLVREDDAGRAAEILKEYFDRAAPEGPSIVK